MTKNLFFFTLILCLVNLTEGCSFQPNDADGIVLLKVSDKVLTLSIIDSYYIIKKYETDKKGDTLFINVISISVPKNSPLKGPILIPVENTVRFVKLQNDKIYNVDSIPYQLH